MIRPDYIQFKELYHYGIPRRSGRYPWGSGDRPFQSASPALSVYNTAAIKEKTITPDELIKKIENENIPTRVLSCSFTMRSNDFCCGNPYNICQYAFLTYMFCEICNMKPGELIYIGNDVHIYENHIEQAEEQISRKGSDIIPKLSFKRKINDIDDFTYEDFVISDYHPDAPIKYPLNVG